MTFHGDYRIQVIYEAFIALDVEVMFLVLFSYSREFFLRFKVLVAGHPLIIDQTGYRVKSIYGRSLSLT